MKQFYILCLSGVASVGAYSVYAGVPEDPAVLTHHNDNSNSGWNSRESALTPASVSSGGFGLLGSFSVDAPVYAQPLYYPNLEVKGKLHNTVIVATMNDSLYAFDTTYNAKTKKLTGGLLWSRSFINPPLVTAVSKTDIPGGLTSLALDGILSTPVINAATGMLYLVARTKVNASAGPEFYYTLHEVNIHTGGVVRSVVITTAGFDPLETLQRAALKFIDGRIFVAFASQADQTPYHGFLFSFNAATLALDGLFNVTPGANESEINQGGGIWMTGAGPVTDESNNIYVATGTGDFDGIKNFSNSILRLTALPEALRLEDTAWLADYFAPPGQATLDNLDLDQGSGGILVLPTNTPTGVRVHLHPHLLVQGGKTGWIYLLNRDDLAGLNSVQNPDLQSTVNIGSPILVNRTTGALEPSSSGIFDTPAYFNNTIYYCAVADVLKAYTIQPNETFLPGPSQVGPDVIGYPGATPSISSNGTKDAIVWLIDPSNGADIADGITTASDVTSGTVSTYIPVPGSGAGAVLRAYDAANISQDLYYTGAFVKEAPGGAAVRFTVPTVADGKVFVGTTATVDIYGLR